MNGNQKPARVGLGATRTKRIVDTWIQSGMTIGLAVLLCSGAPRARAECTECACLEEGCSDCDWLTPCAVYGCGQAFACLDNCGWGGWCSVTGSQPCTFCGCGCWGGGCAEVCSLPYCGFYTYECSDDGCGAGSNCDCGLVCGYASPPCGGTPLQECACLGPTGSKIACDVCEDYCPGRGQDCPNCADPSAACKCQCANPTCPTSSVFLCNVCKMTWKCGTHIDGPYKCNGQSGTGWGYACCSGCGGTGKMGAGCTAPVGGSNNCVVHCNSTMCPCGTPTVPACSCAAGDNPLGGCFQRGAGGTCLRCPKPGNTYNCKNDTSNPKVTPPLCSCY